MKVRSWNDEPVERLADGIGRQLAHTETMTVSRVRFEAGAVIERHAHVNEQVANLLEGRLRYFVGDEERVMEAGETLLLPSNVPHGLEVLADSLVLDIFSPVRDDLVAAAET